MANTFGSFAKNIGMNLKQEVKTVNNDFKDIVIRCCVLFCLAFLSLIWYPFVLVTIGLAGLFILTEKTARSFYYMLFLLPFLNILRKTSSDLYYMVYLWCLLLLILGVKLIISFFVKKDKKINWLYTAMTALFLIYITVVGPLDFTTHGAAYLTIAIMYVMYYYINDLNFKEVVFIFFLGTVLASFSGLFRPLFDRVQSIIPAFMKNNGRFTGVSNDPNYYSGDLILVFACFMVLYLKKDIKYLFYPAMFVVSVFAFNSLSKMMILIYAIILFVFCVFILFKYRMKKGILKCLAISLCFVLSCLASWNQLSKIGDRLTQDPLPSVEIEQGVPSGEDSNNKGAENDSDGTNTSNGTNNYNYRNNVLTVLTTGRTNIWLAYLDESFKDLKSALIGHGVGAPFVFCYNGAKFNYFAEHNTFVQMLYRLGIIGSLLLIAMVLSAINFKKFKLKFENLFPAMVVFGLFMALCNLLSFRLASYLIVLFLSLGYVSIETKDKKICDKKLKLKKTKSDKLLSVIIPCYNCESFLEKCVKSLEDNLKDVDYQIILVDDGSTDKTKELINSLAKKNKNILSLNAIGKGVFDARNTGLQNATGKYVMFVDGDDYVDENLKEAIKLVEEKNCDCLHFSINIDKNGQTSNKQIYEKCFVGQAIDVDSNDIIKIFKNAYSQVGTKIIKRDVIVENNIIFKDYTVAEDMEWVTQLMIGIKTIYISDLAFYHYVRHSSSVMGSTSLKKTVDAINACACAFAGVENSSLSNKKKRALKHFITKTFYSTFQYYGKLNKQDKKALVKVIENNRELLIFNSTPKFLLIRMMQLIFGLDFTLLCMSKILK